MPLVNRNVNYNELIKLTENGLVVADYVQIRNALTKRYKEIYGKDIELSTGSADGQYVEMHSLIFNNILETIKQTYASLDVNQASGYFLDILCALSNVVRKEATRSIAQLALTNVGPTDVTLAANTKFVDKDGTTWTLMNGPKTLEAGASASTSVYVQCDEIGPVAAPAGWITQTLETSTITVVQENDADMGSYQETDAQLRARRNESLSMAGFTVLESLQSSLLATLGIDDVKIYNNPGSTNMDTKVATQKVAPHSIYVILRCRPDILLSDETIGQIIYNKLTPGIGTTVPVSIPSQYVVQITLVLSQTISWKEAVPIVPSTDTGAKIHVTLKTLPNFDQNTALEAICNQVKDYANALTIGTDLEVNPIWSEIVYADPQSRGKATYTVKDVNFGLDGNDDPILSYVNQDRYYNFAGQIDGTPDTSTPGEISFIIK